MYSNISKKIARREAGDDIVTLKSTKLMLDLESLS
jgi:hypothetical protein